MISFARNLLVPAFLLATACTQAQRPGGQRPEMKGRIIGRVFDEASKERVPFASITLLTPRDSVVAGALGKANGDFTLVGVPAGRFTLKISSLGFEELALEVTMTPQHAEQDLGDLRLKPNSAMLAPAEVVGETPRVSLQIDRRVYNVAKDLSVRGGTGEDVMKNVPGLSVDVDGNVTLRNSSPKILVDGRPTSLTLDMIPADDIERVEVITTPGASFEASATGGIVNVVLKKSDRPGYSGRLQAGAGTNGRANANANISVKEDPFSVNASGNFNRSGNNTKAETDRTDRVLGEPTALFHQDGISDGARLGGGGRASIDWNVTNRNTLSASYNFNRRGYENRDDQAFMNRDATGVEIDHGTQVNDQENGGSEQRAQIGMRRKSPTEGREWTADLNWNHSDRNSLSTFTTATDTGAAPEVLRIQRNEGSTLADQITFQLDAQNPTTGKNKFDWGLRAAGTQAESALDAAATTTASIPRYDQTLSNNDYVYAAYGNWGRKLTEHWSLLGGLRVEVTDLTAELPVRNERFTYRYPNGSDDLEKIFFPSLYVSRKWEGVREFQVNLSRKVNRPNFWQVMPFVMFSDSRSYRIGNPALGPEFTWIGEVNHLLPIKDPRNTWLTSVFSKYTTGVITSYAYAKPDDPSVLVSTFVNGDDSWTYGWENTLKFEPRKGMQVLIGGTAQWIEVGLASINARNSGWSFNGKLNASQRFAKTLSLQVNGEYEGQRPVPQGFSMAQYGVDLSMAYEPNKHWTFTASVNDLFDTRRWGTVFDTPTVYQESYRRRDQRNLRVNITWKFGEQNSSLFRKRNNPRREPGAEGGEGGEM